MKLNPDCVRDILIAVEGSTSLTRPIRFGADEMPPQLSTYAIDEILYHVKQCELSGFFADKVSWFISGDCMVRCLSPSGHQFLADIRSDTNWKKTKEIAKNIGSESLSAIKEIATGVITSLIQNQFGLH